MKIDDTLIDIFIEKEQTPVLCMFLYDFFRLIYSLSIVPLPMVVESCYLFPSFADLFYPPSSFFYIMCVMLLLTLQVSFPKNGTA